MRQTRTLLTVVIATLALAVSPLTIQAAPVDQQTARQRAAAFLRGNTSVRYKRAVNPTALTPVDIRTSLFAFNVGERDGFVIVSPDDRTAPILAYSTTGRLDPENMPDNMRAWFQEYANQLAYLAANPATSGSPLMAKGPDDVEITAKSPISPLLSSMWNQTAPYNRRCPIFFNGERCVTGCVATAVAQVMNYYQWPDSTLAQIPAYISSPTYRGGMQIDSIPAGFRLDWANMTDIYQGDESDEQLAAISNLMLAVGASVKMNYRDIANGGSGAFLMDVPAALQTYFGYSPAIHYESRSNYSIDAWEQLVYNELKAKRPVLYQGASSGGGHSFVIDGYSEDHFHVNWGWGNDDCDVWCLLSVLNPGQNEGAGASTSLDGYSYEQSAVFGLRPGRNGDKPYSRFYLSSSIAGVSKDQISCMFVNNTPVSDVFTYGIGYLDEEGEYIPVRISTPREFPSNTGLLNPVSYNVGGLEPGTYHLVPISCLGDSYDWHSSQNPSIDYVEAVVTQSGTTLTRHEPVFNLKADLMVDGTHLINDQHAIRVNIVNQGDEFYGRIYLRAKRLADDTTFDVGAAGLTVRKGESIETQFPFTDVILNPTVSDTILFTLTTEEGPNASVIAQLQESFDPNIEPEPIYTDSIDLITSITNESITADGAYILGTSPRIHVVITNPHKENYKGKIRYKLYKFHNGMPIGAHTQGTSYNLKHHSTDEFDLTLFDGQFEVGDAYAMVVLVQKNGQFPNPPAPTKGKTVVAPVLMYRADGYSLAEISRDTLVVPARAATVDLRYATSTKVVKGGNPNTLYILNEGKAPEGITRNIIRNGQADTITLADGYNFYTPEDIQAKHVRYTRTFRRGFKSATRDGFNTLMLPFSVQKVQVQEEDGVKDIDWARSQKDTGKDFWIMGYNHQDGHTLVFEPAAQFEASHPYLVAVPQAVQDIDRDLTQLPITFSADQVKLLAQASSASTGINYQMNGIRYYQELDSIFALDGTGYQFELADTAVQAFRAYFSIRHPDTYDFSVNKLAIRALVDPLDAIEAPSMDGLSAIRGDEWYTPAGLRVAAPNRKGIFIRRGKKYVVK